MNNPLNGGFWNSIWHGDWAATWANIRYAVDLCAAVIAGARPDWLSTRIIEGVLIAMITSGVTIAGGYFALVVRMDERLASMQRDIDARAAARIAEDHRIEARVDKNEERVIRSEALIAVELRHLSEALARIDERSGGRPSFRTDQDVRDRRLNR